MRTLALALLAVAPGIAAACPSCARDTAPHAALLVAGLIAAPYAVAAVVLHVVRRGEEGGR